MNLRFRQASPGGNVGEIRPVFPPEMHWQFDRFEGVGWGWRGGGKGAGEVRQGLVRTLPERVELDGHVAAAGHDFQPVTRRLQLACAREPFVPVRR